MDVQGIYTADLLEAARTGDWARLETLAEVLPEQLLPTNDQDLAQHLFDLRTALIAARTTRADLVKSLHRLSAASRFGDLGGDG